MNIITIVILLNTIVYMAILIRDIRGYSRTYRLLDNRLNFWLIITAVALGINNFIINYEIEQALQAQVAYTNIPIFSIVKILTTILMQLHVFVWLIRKYTIFNVPQWITQMHVISVCLLIASNLLLYNRIPYYQLQLITSSSSALIALISGYAILPITRTIYHTETDKARRIKFGWFLIGLIPSSIAMLLIFIDGIWKLTHNITTIYTPIYIVAEVLREAQVISGVIMNHGNYLSWLGFPRKFFLYQQLKKLAHFIHQEADIQNVGFPIPHPHPIPSQIDLLILRQYINILDAYIFLPLDSQLRKSIQKLNHPETDYDSNLNMLSNLSQEYL